MKKLFSLLVVFGVVAMCTNAFGYIRPYRTDFKPSTQQMIERRPIDNAIVAVADRILNDQATSASVITTVTTFDAQPDVCRAVGVTPGGFTADVAAGDVTVGGTNVFGEAITEAITIAENGSTLVSGLSAFCTVTSIVFPIQDGGTATFDVGVLDVLGLHRCMSGDKVLMTVFDNAYETTRPTVVYDADEVEKNTVDINGTLNGAKDVEVFFIQNFACLP